LTAEPHSLVFGLPGTVLSGVILDCVFDDYIEALCRNHLGEVKEKRNLRANLTSGCRDVMSLVTRQYPGVAETVSSGLQAVLPMFDPYGADNFCSPQCPNR
jgi:hypothetical protein